MDSETPGRTRSVRRVLVVTDFGEASRRAATWTARHLLAGEELILLHVSPAQRAKDGSESDRRVAESRLADIMAELPQTGARAEVRVGDTATEITAAAADHDVDLIVVGELADRGHLAGFLGHPVERVARHAAVPVLVVRPATDDAPRAILVAVQVTPTVPQLLSWTGWFANRFSARVFVVHVVPPSESVAVTSSGLGASPSRGVEQLSAQRQQWLDDAATSLRGTAGGLTTSVLFGDPATEILAAAERAEANLVIVGRGGIGRPLGRVLAGAAQRLLRSGEASLLIVPDETSAQT